MASISTGEMYTNEQVNKMTVAEKTKLKIVGLTPEEEKLLVGMNRKGRRTWLKANKKFP